MPENTLHHLIYGWPLVSDTPGEQPDVLGSSYPFTPEETAALRSVALDPLPVNGRLESQSVAFFRQPASALDAPFVLARTHYQRDEQRLPIFEYVHVSKSLLEGLGGDIVPLFSLLNQPLPTYPVTNAPLEPLEHPTPTTWTWDRSVELLEEVLDTLKGNLDLLFGVLGAVLNNGALIQHYPLDWHERLLLVRGLWLLLPSPLRSDFSFTTHVTSPNGSLPRLAFSEEAPAGTTSIVDWDAPRFDEALMAQPYIAHLRSLWHGDPVTFVEQVRALDRIAKAMMPQRALVEVVARHMQDLRLLEGESLSVPEIIDVLYGSAPPKNGLRKVYLERLLEHALEERDPDASEWVATAMDEDPALDESLNRKLQQELSSQPDAVYAFVRARVGKGADEPWLTRLREAGIAALQVALETGDPETVASWLTLLGREPARYQLAEVLRGGILAAREHIGKSSKLAQHLLILAVRRQPETLNVLLNDPDVLEALPEPVLEALTNFDSESIDALGDESRELFLLVLRRALEQEVRCINPAAVRRLWEYYQQHPASRLPEPYRPLNLLQEMTQDSACLQDGALEILIALMFANEEDALFFELAPALADDGRLPRVLQFALEQSGRSAEDVLNIMGTLANQSLLQPQQRVDIYTILLQKLAWAEEAMPLVEQLARLLTQFPDTTAEPSVLWHIAELSVSVKSEQMMRVALRRLLPEIEAKVAESSIIEDLQRLRKAVHWSSSGTTQVIRWWRQYVGKNPLGTLQKLDKALAGKRDLAEMRSVVQTSIALRRAIGSRTLAEFGEAVHTTYNLLQALSESFDPGSGLGTNVDTLTLRRELQARADEMPPEARYVLASNLKGLAQLITALAENRSKPGIIRRDDHVERSLATGEQLPQSAIDMLRWFSGYLEGMQGEDEAD